MDCDDWVEQLQLLGLLRERPVDEERSRLTRLFKEMLAVAGCFVYAAVFYGGIIYGVYYVSKKTVLFSMWCFSVVCYPGQKEN